MSGKLVKLVILGLILTSNVLVKASNKRAILVGVGLQPKDTKWEDTYAGNDVKVMQESLKNKGFADVQSLKDEQATKEKTIAALEEAYKKCQEGDVFLFYFSGHGQLVRDMNADEPDLYDESLVLFGAPKYYDEAYDFENHLLDEELSEWLNKIRIKVGSNGEVMLLIDASFTLVEQPKGSNSRGGGKPMDKDSSLVKEITMTYDIGILDDMAYAAPSNNYAPINHITAGEMFKPIYDFSENGVFTLAVSRAFETISDSTTYNDFFESVAAICREINPNQSPKWEGFMENRVFEYFSKDENCSFSNILVDLNTELDETELKTMFSIKENQEKNINREANKTDWEKSFFKD